MGFAADSFSQNRVPSVDVCAHVVEGFAVYVQVNGRVWWSVEDCVEVYVSAKSMRKENACHDAFVNDVKSSCVVQVVPVRFCSSQTRIKKKLSHANFHGSLGFVDAVWVRLLLVVSLKVPSAVIYCLNFLFCFL